MSATVEILPENVRENPEALRAYLTLGDLAAAIEPDAATQEKNRRLNQALNSLKDENGEQSERLIIGRTTIDLLHAEHGTLEQKIQNEADENLRSLFERTQEHIAARQAEMMAIVGTLERQAKLQQSPQVSVADGGFTEPIAKLGQQFSDWSGKKMEEIGGWSPQKKALVATATLGIIGLGVLWYSSRNKKDQEGKQGILRRVLPWIPVIGILGIAAFSGYQHLKKNSEWFRQVASSVESALPENVKKTMDVASAVDEGTKKGMTETKENFRKAFGEKSDRMGEALQKSTTNKELVYNFLRHGGEVAVVGGTTYFWHQGKCILSSVPELGGIVINACTDDQVDTLGASKEFLRVYMGSTIAYASSFAILDFLWMRGDLGAKQAFKGAAVRSFLWPVEIYRKSGAKLALGYLMPGAQGTLARVELETTLRKPAYALRRARYIFFRKPLLYPLQKEVPIEHVNNLFDQWKTWQKLLDGAEHKRGGEVVCEILRHRMNTVSEEMEKGIVDVYRRGRTVDFIEELNDEDLKRQIRRNQIDPDNLRYKLARASRDRTSPVEASTEDTPDLSIHDTSIDDTVPSLEAEELLKKSDDIAKALGFESNPLCRTLARSIARNPESEKIVAHCRRLGKDFVQVILGDSELHILCTKDPTVLFKIPAELEGEQFDAARIKGMLGDLDAPKTPVIQKPRPKTPADGAKGGGHASLDEYGPENRVPFVEDGGVASSKEGGVAVEYAEDALGDATPTPAAARTVQVSSETVGTAEDVLKASDLPRPVQKIILKNVQSATEAQKAVHGISALAKIGVGVDVLLVAYEGYMVVQLWQEVGRLAELEGQDVLIKRALEAKKSTAIAHTQSFAVGVAASYVGAALTFPTVVPGAQLVVAAGATGGLALIAIPVGMAIRAGMTESLNEMKMHEELQLNHRIEGLDEVILAKSKFDQLYQLGDPSAVQWFGTLFNKSTYEDMKKYNAGEREEIILAMVYRGLRDLHPDKYAALLAKLAEERSANESVDALRHHRLSRRILLPYLSRSFVGHGRSHLRGRMNATDIKELKVFNIDRDGIMTKSFHEPNKDGHFMETRLTEERANQIAMGGVQLVLEWLEKGDEVGEWNEIKQGRIVQERRVALRTQAEKNVQDAFGSFGEKVLSMKKEQLIALRKRHAEVFVDLNYYFHSSLEGIRNNRDNNEKNGYTFAPRQTEDIATLNERLAALNEYLQLQHAVPKLIIEAQIPEGVDRGMSPETAFHKVGDYEVNDRIAANLQKKFSTHSSGGVGAAPRVFELAHSTRDLHQASLQPEQKWLEGARRKYEQLLLEFRESGAANG